MADKIDVVKLLQDTPKRKLSEVEKQTIFILIEKSKLSRERSLSNFNKGFMFFGLFIVLAFISKFNNMISETMLNILFIAGIVLLIVVTLIYQSDLKKEESMLDELLSSFLR